MASIKNGRALFNEIPSAYPEPGKTTVYDESETIDPETVPLNGGFIVKTLVLSVDPYLRGKMREASAKSYSASFEKGKPLYNYGVGVVLRSENSAVKVGDHVYGVFPFQKFFIRPSLEGVRILENKEKLPWSTYLGAAGMPGQTAFFAWKEYSQSKKGDIVFVTAGAGPVGSLVIQIAKSEGLKVIASAGSEEKLDFIRSLGADVVFNYKTTKTADVLEKEGPIDIYWDNVGGESLDAALKYANHKARFLECGMISDYNEKAPPVTNLVQIVAKELKISGFLVFSLAPKHIEWFYNEIPGRIANGELKILEDFKKGLEYGGHAIEDVQRGRNYGKSVIVVAEE
ncbi:hypothetical protein PHLGIDRAFT_112558 [Phlebiopsis gigantea 11061_1 CR5-6]|uniref:Enoyl reductase (ER) domain-containing protein n=1 Tax=Phlebiopsis gigantea (strain 11061_1 CR5-6) TaxID=745531 RepID=A0A0C3NBW0_PHLG1|nr:hypothetical protein PHLGIDRAFT_112558 [Phlebiopsis gigantea 11061_1 CR5-6]